VLNDAAHSTEPVLPPGKRIPAKNLWKNALKAGLFQPFFL
jgi:hypothetical protein